MPFRVLVESFIEGACEKIAGMLEKRVIYRRDGKPYLERYYLFHGSRFKKLPGIYLHKFLSSDEDYELHDHPWNTSVSLILSKGYEEERREEYYANGKLHRRVVIEDFSPGMFNLITKDDFHRVTLKSDHAWTLFMSGDRQKDWGFWSRDTDEYTPWRTHIAKKKES